MLFCPMTAELLGKVRKQIRFTDENMKRIRLILLSMMLLLSAGCSGNTAQKDADHPFDFYIDCTTQGDIESLSEEPFVKGVFPFTLMIFQRPGYSHPMEGQIAFLAVPSLDGIEFSPYHRGRLKKEDSAILQDPARNPILIDETMAKAEKLSVGDVFYQETKITGEPMEFTVAGIFRHAELFAQFEAIVLINEQISRIFSGIVDELGYTNAYVKASDPSALKAYFDEGFIPHLMLKGLSEDVIASIQAEDLKVSYEDYESHMNRMH